MHLFAIDFKQPNTNATLPVFRGTGDPPEKN